MTDTPVPEERPYEDPRDAVIREQAERIAALEALVDDLREQLAAAERAGSRNSGNSSMPPSLDDLPGRKMPRKQRRAAEREAAKRKRGKQPGSPGASMTWEVPDRTEDHYPEGACACGADLAAAEDLGVVRSYQQKEIPAAAAERVQHDLHEAKCACGRVHAAARPAGVPEAALSLGPRLRALAVYLTVFRILAGRPQPGFHGGRRDPPGFRRDRGLRPLPELRAPRGALLYRLLSRRRTEEVSLDLMPYRRPKG